MGIEKPNLVQGIVSSYGGARVSIHLDSIDGTLFGEFNIGNTGGNFSGPVQANNLLMEVQSIGVHDVYLKVSAFNNNSVEIDRLQFKRPHVPLASDYGSGRNDVFLVHCGYSHTLKDDPIVYPGQPGASHTHDFFGSTTTNANSTDASMIASGSTCNIAGDTAGYWTPALYDLSRK